MEMEAFMADPSAHALSDDDEEIAEGRISGSHPVGMWTPSSMPPSPNDQPDACSERLYTPKKGERQLTVRAVVTGCLLGGLVSAMNIYFGLKTGWSIGGSLIAAILGYAVWAIAKPKEPFTLLEANITQTAGSGAGTMTSAAGLLAAIPALGLILQEHLTRLPKDTAPGDGATPLLEHVPRLGYLELTLWGLSVAFLGVFFSIPLRRQMILEEKLRFPSGTATANTLVAMFSTAGEALEKARTLVRWAVGAALFTLAAYFLQPISFPPLAAIPWPVWTAGGASAFAVLHYMTFRLYMSPLMFGAGVLIGFRVALSLFLGALVAWGLLGPYVEAQDGWVTPGRYMSYAGGVRGWVLWPGVAIMVAEALTSLALSWRTILRTFTGSRKRPAGDGSFRTEARSAASAPESISFKVWVAGLLVSSALTVGVAWWVFDIPWWMTLVAIGLSSILAMIAVRSTGETDINPIGGMGKVTQLAFGALAPGSKVINLMAAAISGAGASQAGDMMHDLKTGHLLGASPRRQLVAQLCGVSAGILFCIPIYKLFDAVYDIGRSEEMPAPAAGAWKAMADLLTQGFEALPPNVEWAIAAGVAFGVLVPVLRKVLSEARRKYIPSGLAFGIAFIVPAFYSISMFIGALAYLFWSRKHPDKAERLGFAIASGLIAGEGLMGIVTALLQLFGVPPLVEGLSGH